MTNKYQHELKVAKELAFLAGKAIMDVYFGETDKHLKADGTPVTNADLASNRIIVEGLQRYFPHDGIVSEEMEDIYGTTENRKWYIDPLDGTRGFIHRTDHFVVHIGLVEAEHPVLGVVYKPTTGESYYTAKGLGAYRSNPHGAEKILKVDSPIPESITLSVSNRYFKERINQWKILIFLVSLAALPLVLILKQPDFGTFIIVTFGLTILFFVSPLKPFT